MNLKSFVGVLAGAVVAGSLFAGSANAALVDTFTIEPGDLYVLDDLTAGGIGSTYDLAYQFDATADVGTITTAISLPALGGVRDLVLSWSNDLAGTSIISSLAVTDNDGDIINLGAELVLTLLNGNSYFLLITSGETLVNALTVDVRVSTVPIPPALLLFGSALAGVGFLSRKRKKQEPSLL